jgi:organic radical activating enzyme
MAENIKDIDGFCILPFIHLSTRTDGRMQICCTANSDSTHDEQYIGCNRKDDGGFVELHKDKPQDYWNTKYMRTLRQGMLNGERPNVCRKCYKEEESGYRSKRMWENDLWSDQLDYNKIVDKMSTDGSMPYGIHYIDMKLGNKCNLACVMCNPADSSLWIPDWNKLKKCDISSEVDSQTYWNKNEAGAYNWYKKSETYWDSLKENIDQLYSVYIIGGEPTVNPEFYKFLRDCVETGHAGHIDLRFNTNGQTLDEELKELYTHFKSVTLHLSMDGTHDRYTYIRHPGTWQNQLDSLHWHDQLSNNVNVGIDCTAMALNAWHLPDFIVWKMNQKFKNITVYPNFGGMIGLHILWQPPLLSVQVLPKELKEEILVRYTNVIKWANTHHQPREGKGVNNNNRLRAVANHMMKEDKSNQWPYTIEYLDNMDSIRNTDWRTTFPELARYE